MGYSFLGIELKEAEGNTEGGKCAIMEHDMEKVDLAGNADPCGGDGGAVDPPV
jgi:hypothetical protein